MTVPNGGVPILELGDLRPTPIRCLKEPHVSCKTGKWKASFACSTLNLSLDGSWKGICRGIHGFSLHNINAIYGSNFNGNQCYLHFSAKTPEKIQQIVWLCTWTAWHLINRALQSTHWHPKTHFTASFKLSHCSKAVVKYIEEKKASEKKKRKEVQVHCLQISSVSYYLKSCVISVSSKITYEFITLVSGADEFSWVLCSRYSWSSPAHGMLLVHWLSHFCSRGGLIVCVRN